MTRFIFILGALLLVGPVRAAEQVPGQVQMKNTLQSYFDAMNEGDAAKIKAMFAPDAMIEDPLGAALRPATAFIDAVLPAKLNFNVLLLTATQSNIAAAALFIATPNGGLNAIEVFTFNPDGKITGMKAYWSASDRQ